MPKLFVTSRLGVQAAVDGEAGLSVMEIVRDAGFGESFGMCGGVRSCATCHVYVEPGFADRMPPMGDDENDLLDGSDSRRPSSRLSCQIPFGQALDGLTVEIAPGD